MIFRDGILLFRQPGAIPGNALEDLISQVSELNMDDVRKQIADEEAKKSG
jgi:thioredoxin 1